MCSTEEYIEYFKEADLNGDGALSLRELIHSLRKHGYPGTDDEIAAFFHNADITGDQRISLDEYMIAMGKIPPNYHKSAVLRRVFDEFDQDGSGEIDVRELKSIFKQLGEKVTNKEAKKIMKAADTDGSGTISFDEFVKACLD